MALRKSKKVDMKYINKKSYNPICSFPQNNSNNNYVENYVEKIKLALHKIDDIIIAVYLFGSTVSNKQNSLSDIDIAVLLKENVDYFEYMLQIHHDIAKITKKEADVVVLNTVRNLYLIDSIINKGILIMDNDRGKRTDYELRLSHAILDYKSFRYSIDAK